jgi:Domain of unknown function (DUF1830)
MMQEFAAETIHDLTADVEPAEEAKQDTSEVLSAPTLCCYVNATRRIQVVRLSHLSEGEWEHILFPAQTFMFEAPPEAMLEVYKSPTLSITPPEYILCRTLQVQSDQ